MDWSRGVQVLGRLRMPTGYLLRQLDRALVPAAVEQLADWYPDLMVSGERCHLDPHFYYAHAALAGEGDTARDLLPLVAMHDGKLVGMVTFQRDVPSRTLACRVGALAPAHRGPALALLGPMLLEAMGRAIDAALVLYYATLQTPHQQLLAERCRFTLVGIIPACDDVLSEGGGVKRAYEGLYAKVLADAEHVERPPRGALTARTAAVWKALFGEHAQLSPEVK